MTALRHPLSFLTLALAAVVLACPPPDTIRGNGAEISISTVETGSDGFCPEAFPALDEGDFSRAVEILTASPSPSPDEDLCLSRAFLGMGQDEDALSIAGPLSTAPGVEARTRAAACTTAVWAATRSDRLAEAINLLDRCDGELSVDVDDVLLVTDDIPVATVLFEVRRQANRYVEALDAAQWLFEIANGVDEATRSWVMSNAFALSPMLSDWDKDQLEQRSSPLLTALVSHADLLGAIEEGDDEAVGEQLPVVQARLLALQAEEIVLDLQDLLFTMENARPVVIGGVLTLSGPQRQAGRAVLAGLLLAQDAFQPQDEPTSLLLIRDSGQTAQSAAAAVAELDSAGVLAIIGPADPVLAAEVAREAGLRGIPTLSLTRDPAVTDTSRWTFQLFASPRAEAELLLETSAMYGLRRVAVAAPAPTPDYMRELIEAFEEGAAHMGIAVEELVTYYVDDLQAEAEATAAQLAARDFDALLIADTGENATTLAAYLGVHDIWSRPVDRPASATRREIVFLGTSFWHHPDFLASGPDYLAGGLFPSWVPVESDRFVTTEFSVAFETTYARRPGLLGAFAFDALQLLRLISLDDGVRTRQGVWRALDQAAGVEGATGDIGFDEQRTTTQQPVLFSVTRGGFEPR